MNRRTVNARIPLHFRILLAVLNRAKLQLRILLAVLNRAKRGRMTEGCD